jgi:hypothetical protein
VAGSERGPSSNPAPIGAESKRSAIAIGALTLISFIYARAVHEPWVDEAQALLVARATPWRGFYAAMHLEGVTPLFHAALKILAFVLPAPVALNVAAAAGYAMLLYGAYSLLLAISDRPRASLVAACALGVGDTFGYELGVVARQYGLGLGLALLATARLYKALDGGADRRGEALAGGAIAALAVITSIHAGCVASGAVGAFVFIQLARGDRRRALYALVPLLPALGAALLFIGDDPRRALDATKLYDRKGSEAARVAFDCLRDGIAASGWWLNGKELELKMSILGVTLGAIATAIGAQLTRGRAQARGAAFALATVTLANLPLLYILVFRWSGGYRHHLFLCVPALVLALGFLLRDSTARATLALRIMAAIAFLPWAYCEWLTSARDLSRDAEDAFAETRDAAPLLAADAYVIADNDAMSVGLLLFRDDLHLRALNSHGRVLKFAIPDRERDLRVQLGPMLRDTCRIAPDRTYLVLGRGDQAGGPCAGPSLPHRRSPRNLGPFDLHHVDCACVAAKPAR